MDQVTRKWGPGLKANEGNVSATEPSQTLKSRGREQVDAFFASLLARCFSNGFPLRYELDQKRILGVGVIESRRQAKFRRRNN